MSLKKIVIAIAAGAFSIAASAAPVLSGIQTNVSQASYIASGWNVISSVSTAASTRIANDVAGLAMSDRLAVGVLDNRTGLFVAIAETTLGSFETYTAFNQTHNDNGVAWYYNGLSLGFTQVGFAIQQDYADINLENAGNIGLSWHAETDSGFNVSASPTQFYGGWAANNGHYVGTWSNDYNRVFLTTSADSVADVPEPGSIALLSLGLLGMGVVARRRKN